MKQNISRDKSAFFKNTTSVFFSVSTKRRVEVWEAERREILQVSHRTLISSSFNAGSLWRCTFVLRLIKTALMRKITHPHRYASRLEIETDTVCHQLKAYFFIALNATLTWRGGHRGISPNITSLPRPLAALLVQSNVLHCFSVSWHCSCYIACNYIEWHWHFNLVNPTFLHISPFWALIDVKTITSMKSSASRSRDGFFPTVIRTHMHHQDAVRMSNIDQDEENDKRQLLVSL